MRTAILGTALVAVLGALALSAGQAENAAAQSGDKSGATKPVHGLKAEFYSQKKGDEFRIPVPTEPPVATRIDAQIAFGRGKGFLKSISAPWWEPKSWLSFAAVWKGYIRLPKAGTYYLTTASADSSAVYLRGSRVALNGFYGGAIPSEAFTYDAPEPAYGLNSHAYVVPVTAEAPRVLPIEVRFSQHNLGGGIGIDLLWVTPDSPRDPKTGKPVAQIVPKEALFVEPPGPIDQPTTRAANCTISCDYLDLPIEGETYATVTVRLADKDGRPVPGHRVHVASAILSSDASDVIVQPQKPTDANGVTTAKVRHGWGYPHDSQLYAFDVADVVQVAQVAHLRTVKVPPTSFFPRTFGPYYDGQNFVISPRELRVGQATTVTVPLTNRQDIPYELRVRLSVCGWNIGGRNCKPVGESEPFVLKPNENHEAKVVWRPEQSDAHVCFKVEVLGGRVKPKAVPGAWRPTPADLLALTAVSLQAPSPSSTPLESRHYNVGPVSAGDAGPLAPPEIGQGPRPKTAGGSSPVGQEDSAGAGPAGRPVPDWEELERRQKEYLRDHPDQSGPPARPEGWRSRLIRYVLYPPGHPLHPK